MTIDEPVNVIEAEHACLSEVKKLYDQGFYLQAYNAGKELGPLHTWQGTRAKVMACRLANNLGSSRLGLWLARCAHRNAPNDAEAKYFYALGLPRFRGLWGTWQWLKKQPEFSPEADSELRASWAALQAGTLACLRDFSTAEIYFRKAESLSPQSAWIKVCRASAWIHEDRYDDAIAIVREALQIRPGYRPAVQEYANLLVYKNKDDEALDLLQKSSDQMESLVVTFQLLTLQMEHKLYRLANETLDRVDRLCVLREKKTQQWLDGYRSEIAYFLGDYENSIRLARQSDTEFAKAVADRMEKSLGHEVPAKILPVGFVRQHHVTCVPATLTAISHYWGMPADHLQMAEKITYNGTSNYNERKWATDNGWIAREFSVTEESACQLIDRNIPFTFTTINPGSAHLQAIIGYDKRRGTLWVRDPYWRSTGEGLTEKMIATYERYGPRGMAMVPRDQAALLDNLELPDEKLWDQLHTLDGVLIAHDRNAAELIIKSMVESSPEHRLTLEAQWRVARYDANVSEQLNIINRLLKQFPEEQNLLLSRLSFTQGYEFHEQRLADYERACSNKENAPIFWQYYAQELRSDARLHEKAELLLSRALKRWPTHAGSYHTLAGIRWDQRQFEEAFELYRIAACLSDKEESYVLDYFRASIWLKQSEAVLEYLRARCAKWEDANSNPAKTLAAALQQLDHYHEAGAVIQHAMSVKPDDGELCLFAVDQLVGVSSENLPKARELLNNAREKTSRLDWLTAAARLERSAGNYAESIKLWREVIELVPVSYSANSSLAALLVMTEGEHSALAHLASLIEKFPHQYPLHQLYIEQLRKESDEKREGAIVTLLKYYPDDAWAHRELGHLLCDQKKLAEAMSEADHAEQLEPRSTWNSILRARIHQARREIDQAKNELIAAISLSVDCENAINGAMEMCQSIVERREVLQHVRAELQKQVIFGDGLSSYRDHASSVLEPQELLTHLEEARKARPDLWHAWSAVMLQLMDLNLLDEAWKIAREATDRFPALPRLWLDRALVSHARLDSEDERMSLESAYRINPGWTQAARRLATHLYEAGDSRGSREILENALIRNPQDYLVHIELAELLWNSGEREAALDRLRKLLTLEVGYMHAWDFMSTWSQEMDHPEYVRDLARELTRTKPAEARSWSVLARILGEDDETEERLQAMERAIELNPHSADFYNEKAFYLTRINRFDDAISACNPDVFVIRPTLLKAREAWIYAQKNDLKTAIVMTCKIVEEEPFYYWAWSNLADWYRANADEVSYLEAAEAMVKINPQYEVCLGYYAEALERNGRKEDAEKVYAKAYELNPRYDFAGMSVFDYRVEAERFDEAEETLKTLRRFSPGPYVEMRGAILSLKRNDQDGYVDLLCKLCKDTNAPNGVIEKVTQVGIEKGWETVVSEKVSALLNDPNANPYIGRAWASFRMKHDIAQCAEELRELNGNISIAREATRAFLETVPSNWPLYRLTQYVNANRSWFAQDDDKWAMVGWCYIQYQQFDLAYRWYKGWESRNLEAWVYINVNHVCRNRGKDAEGHDACSHALTAVGGNTLHSHRIWLAYDALLLGDVSTANELMKSVQGFEPSDYDYFMNLAVRILLDLYNSNQQQRPPIADSLRTRVRNIQAQVIEVRTQPLRVAVYRETLWRVAKEMKSVRGWLWWFHKSFRLLFG